MGIHGVVAHAAIERKHEIGIRMALGARGHQVLKMLVAEGLVPVLAGLLFGVAGALALTRSIEAFLFGVGSFDPASVVSQSVFLLAVGFVAILLPALRAASIHR